MFGYYHVAAIKNRLILGKPLENANSIITLYKQASKQTIQVALFPELSLTGSTCRDYFHFNQLKNEISQAIELLKEATQKSKTILIVGTPFELDGFLFNCAIVFAQGKIQGIIPKMNITAQERKFFTCGNHRIEDRISINNEIVPFSSNLIFKTKDSRFTFAVEIGQDAFAPIPPSANAAIMGASVIFHLDAQEAYIDTIEERKQQLLSLSKRLHVAYISSSSDESESPSDFVCSGTATIIEDGVELKSRQPFSNEAILCAYIDTQLLAFIRSKSIKMPTDLIPYHPVQLSSLATLKKIERKYEKAPFYCDENAILNTQTVALSRALQLAHAKSIIIGVSGGLDSTLALLVAHNTKTPVIAVTMPGLGSSNRTKNNALTLCKELKIECLNIDISQSVKLHLKEIGHDGKTPDVTFENAQARERTQILMDLANKYQGIVLGTGDLSELALGWCTYNGDHMSMFAINSSLPKTIIAKVVKFYAQKTTNKQLSTCLNDILNTPISPELLPHKNHIIQQCTEAIIGPYPLHDFFIYHTLQSAPEKDKLLFMATSAFSGTYTQECIINTLTIFYSRFFTQQFKRSCAPDGAKIYSLSLARFDYRLF